MILTTPRTLHDTTSALSTDNERLRGDVARLTEIIDDAKIRLDDRRLRIETLERERDANAELRARLEAELAASAKQIALLLEERNDAWRDLALIGAKP